MNSRRLCASPRPKIASYHIVEKTVLCITANLTCARLCLGRAAESLQWPCSPRARMRHEILARWACFAYNVSVVLSPRLHATARHPQAAVDGRRAMKLGVVGGLIAG